MARWQAIGPAVFPAEMPHWEVGDTKQKVGQL